MTDICETVLSQKGNPKLVVNGYLLVKERSKNTLFSWCCEKRKSLKCSGRAQTTFTDGVHHLRNFTEHNHAPGATDRDVTISTSKIKTKARDSRELPGVIIRDETNLCSTSAQPLYAKQGCN